MKRYFAPITSLLVFSACNPDVHEIQRRELARRQSIEEARIATVKQHEIDIDTCRAMGGIATTKPSDVAPQTRRMLDHCILPCDKRIDVKVEK